MKKLFLGSTVALTLTVSHGQNLVPNPSFENYSACPSGLDEVYKATGWTSFRDSPDYFHVCSTYPLVSIPDNIGGNQSAFSGTAYCGLYGYITSGFYRECIGAQLNSILTIGQKYFVSFKVNRAGKQQYIMACDKLGVLFSTISYNVTNPAPINNYAHLYTNSIITDSTNWIAIAGSFIADSAYQYIILGNFFDDANTNTLSIGTYPTPPFRGYYYIDDVCVSTDSITCYQETAIGENLLYKNTVLYPNPFSTQTTFQTDNLLHNATLTVNNCFGQTVAQIKNINGQTITFHRDNLPSGLYFFRITQDNKTISADKFVITDK